MVSFSSCLISPEDPKMVVWQEPFCTAADLGEGTETAQVVREQAGWTSWQTLVLWTERSLGSSGRVTLSNHCDTVAVQSGPCLLTITLQECSAWSRIRKATAQKCSGTSNLRMLLSMVEAAPTEMWLVSGSQLYLVLWVGTSSLGISKGKLWGNYLAFASSGSAKAFLLSSADITLSTLAPC